MRVQPLGVTLRSASRRTFTTVFLAAAVIVLLACLNVTGLAAARVADRRRELTLRRALGGSSGDLVRLLGAESLVVVGLGSSAGVIASLALVQVVARFLPETLVLFKPLAVDARVVGFAAIASALCVVVTTLWPARAALGASLRPTLADSRGTTRRQRPTSRFVLVSAQVTIGLVLTVGGALLAGSLARVSAEDPGFQVDRTFHIWISSRVPPTWALIESLLDDVRRVPGVSAAGGSNVPFLQRSVMGSSFAAPAGAIEESNVESPGVTRGFFETMGIRLVAGRLPTERELGSGAPVVVVSERVARDYWRGGSVIGQTLVRRGQTFTVIGIVSDARYLALDIDPDGTVYYPLGADEVPTMINLFVRFDRSGPADLTSVLSLLSSRHPAFRLRSAQHVATTLGDSVRNRRFQTLIFSAFALAALVIVGAGVLGLVAIVTSRRTREIGVRMALGSRPGQIAWMIVRQELTAVGVGLAAGSLVAAWAVGFVRAYLYKTSVYDPSIWLLAAFAVLTVAAMGALLPALRASRVDPVRALRVD
jgi:putative ABC transport system permease protein